MSYGKRTAGEWPENEMGLGDGFGAGRLLTHW